MSDATVTWDGFDDAIVGLGCRCGQIDVVVYDYDKMVEILSADMSEEDAQEYIDFNIIGAWVGTGTPIIMHSMTAKELQEEKGD